jgi:hypothetical protein
MINGGIAMVFRRSMTVSVMGVCLALSGCGMPKGYWYDEVRYPKPKQALEAQRAAQDETIAKIQPLAEPVGGRALVILPDRELIWAHVAGPKESYSKSAKEFTLATNEMTWELHSEAVKKRHIFRMVEVQRSAKPDSLLASDYDAIIYPSSNLMQWLMKTRKGTEPSPVYVDESKPQGTERIVSWLEYIESVLAEQ